MVGVPTSVNISKIGYFDSEASSFQARGFKYELRKCYGELPPYVCSMSCETLKYPILE